MVQSNGMALPGTLLMTDLASTSMHSIPRNSGVSKVRRASSKSCSFAIGDPR